MHTNHDWLLGSEPWTAYCTRIKLLGQHEEDVEAKRDKAAVLTHPIIGDMIEQMNSWQETPITNHKKAGLWLHKLAFLAEIGLTANDDVRLKAITAEMVRRMDEQGVQNVLVNIPKVFGGRGQDEWAWMLCDAPLAMYAVLKMYSKAQVRRGVEYLCTRAEDFGWSCVASPQLGRFKGPGKRTDPCPYGTLLMLKLLAQFEDLRKSDIAHTGVQCILELWENSHEARPFLFRMGTDFRKIKAPFVWYDIVHVLDVLSQFDWVKEDGRFVEMLRVVEEKADADGRYTPESVWMAYKGFDFAQKKAPSSWITFLINRIQKRIGA